MNEILHPTTRRTVLQRGLVLIAGALGLPLAAPEARSEALPPPPSPPPATPGGKTLQFYARRLLVHCPGQKPGEFHARSGRLHSHGELLDRPGGARVGEFSATCLGPESSFGCAGTDHAVELQTLKVADGTLFGIGSAGPAAEGERAHAILGGTGRFAGAQGSYVIRQSPAGRGEESFEFLITLLT
jgi:hypothetical protein